MHRHAAATPLKEAGSRSNPHPNPTLLQILVRSQSRLAPDTQIKPNIVPFKYILLSFQIQPHSTMINRCTLFFLLLSAVATLNGQRLPTSSLCSPVKTDKATIVGSDCRDAAVKFRKVGQFIPITKDHNTQMCGTCKLEITTPSLPPSAQNSQHLVSLADFNTAFWSGVTTCKGLPANVTIGVPGQQFSVLLEYGPGGKCSNV
ncbi:hypothetical protein O181_027272 [Austropuccinia psidii MF-1]|uniref:Uncharacterized protein n=1 Tax=Austropuccinia psidii MF-1 TaxID=1389203 RepID=A0A9Q3H1J1_9BASI|nr:hypothetical protein [Austropuccinia psidii MF-1]